MLVQRDRGRNRRPSAKLQTLCRKTTSWIFLYGKRVIVGDSTNREEGSSKDGHHYVLG